MKALFFSALLLVGASIVAVMSGCGGTATALNPNINFTFPEDTSLPVMSAGEILVIKGEMAEVSEGDALKSVNWRVESSVPGFTGTITAPDNLETSWESPIDWTGPGRLQVTLILTVDTIMGGHTVKHINIEVLPFGTGADPTVTLSSSSASLLANGAATITADVDLLPGDSVDTTSWSQHVSGSAIPGILSTTQGLTTTWTAPNWTNDTPMTVTITFEVTTRLGGQASQSITLVVNRL